MVGKLSEKMIRKVGIDKQNDQEYFKTKKVQPRGLALISGYNSKYGAIV